MIFSIGELLVEFVSHETGCGLKNLSTYSGPFPSGAPAIFADQAAMVGAKSAVIGSIGDDPFGQIILDRLNNDGVETRYITKSAHRTTGTAFVSYFHDGSRTFVFHLDGTAADDISNIPTLENGSILHISGASLGSKNIRNVIMDLVRQSKSNCRISYDPNIRPELMKDASIQSCINEIMDAADILLPSETDLAALYPGVSPETFIKEMLSKGKTAVIVKCGAKGAIGSNGNEILRAKPILVDEIDPTGAGDCFCGTFLGLLDQQHDFTFALSAANIAGALHVSRRGPMEWNPSLQDINDHSKLKDLKYGS
ncbi:MAG: sugar kinase [Lentilitoribacter sp.]